MIVISHSWEFVPKGSSSQLNYNTSSSNTANSNLLLSSNTKLDQNNKNSTCTANDAQSSNPNQPPQFYLHKSHLNRFYSNQNLNQRPSLPEDNNSSLSEISFAYLHKSPLINNINFETSTEKWHLKQINEFCESEIFIKDNKVILSYGVDNESKCIKRTFNFDSPIFDCNWFNFKTDSNEFGVLRDSLCIFEAQKIHVYFQNGSDFHVPLPFKLKNCWKLRDGILIERQIDYNSLNTPSYFRPTHSTQVLFSLSNPLDDIKPILCKTSSTETKGAYFRENTKQLIVDVIESLNLVLVFSLLNNVHYMYRITENISEDTQVVNNLLNGTILPDQFESVNQNNNLNLNTSNLVTPLPKPESGSCLSLSVNQSKKRLSVSPIISTFSFYNKLNLNSPLVTNQNTTITTTTTTTTSTTTTTVQTTATSTQSSNTLSATSNLITAHQNFLQRNFSPMATVSRSPTCSSSPAIINSVRRCSINTQSTLTSSRNQIQTNSNLQVNTATNFMTPLIEVNNHPYNQYRTPLNHQHTPMNINTYKRSFTPILNTTINTIGPNETPSEAQYEQAQSEYCFELCWTEPVVVSGDSTFNEKASKFFCINDLYNQKFVCYLMPVKSQLRCLKIDYSPETDQAVPVGNLSYISAKDALYVENRSLMVVIDVQGGLFVYSGLTKLCKLQLHNIVWSNSIYSSLNQLKKNSKELFQSPIITPVKSKLFSSNNIIKPSLITTNTSTGEILQTSIDESLSNQNVYKTPKQAGSKGILSSSVGTVLQQQQEFKALSDSTGSRFNVKLNDNRVVRVNLTETSTCKLVNMCLEAFKYTLNKEIYYEIIQQWYIHRYNVGGESIKNQLNLFLYLILNLCGCFDMARLEQDLTFLCMSNTNSNNSNSFKAKLQRQSDRFEKLNETIEETNEMDNSQLADNNNQSIKRAKCFYEGTDEDWEFLTNDDLVHKFLESEKNLKEFDYLNLKKKIDREESSREINQKNAKTSSENTVCNTNENIKTPGGQFSRQKRSISSTQGSIAGTIVSYSASSGGILFPYLKNILYTLHLIYEESKLYKSLNAYSESLILVLYLLSNELNLQLYMNYYEMEFPILLKLKSKKVFQTSNTNSSSTYSNSTSLPLKNSSLSHLIQQEPPVLNKFLLKLLENGSSNEKIINPFPVINSVTKRIVKSIKIYGVIALCTNQKYKNLTFEDFLNQLFFKVNFSGFQCQSSEFSTDKLNSSFYNNFANYTLKFNFKQGTKYIYENVFSLCLEMGLCTLDEIYDYPLSVLFPILESINWSRENPCFSWPPYAFNLIGRNDLAILKANSDAISAETTKSNLTSLNEINEENEAHTNSSSSTSYVQNQLVNLLTFAKNRPSKQDPNNNQENGLSLNILQNMKKEEEDGMEHVMLLETLKCRFNQDLRIKEIRTCLQTTRPIQIKLNQGPDVSDHDFLEEEEKFLACICVRTMSLPVGRGIFTLHTVNPIPTEPVMIPELNLKGKSLSKKTTIDLSRVEIPNNMTYWPLFHNGVAAGLTINAQAKDLSNAWIKSHLAKNFELTNEQAGFLYGLGLTGHLANLSMLNIHDALTRRHDLTNIAILLGLAASKIGSMDLSVTRLISMHIKSLMPPVEIELETPYNIQIAALLSLGLVYVKTANKHISYVLLKEIGRLPGNEADKDLHSLDREAYSLTAGLALGLILLEKGKKSLTIMDSTFTDELYHYMVGGHKEKYMENSTGYSSNVGSSSNNPSNPQTNSDNNFSTTNTNFRPTNSSYIREGESINTNVTCPGATLALGLIYFNTCDKLISEWFAPPDSAFSLDSIRPDFLLLRTLARNLIMWKQILPTQDWLLGQLSNLLKTCLKSDKVLSEKFSYLVNTLDGNINTNLNETKTKSNLKTKSKKTVGFNLKTKSTKIIYKETDDEELEESQDEEEFYEENESEVELIDELNDDTDEDDNIVIQKEKRVKSSKPKGSKSPKQKHLLSDLIQFDDVQDEDFFDDEIELIDDKPSKSKKSKPVQDDNDDEYEDLANNFDTNSSSSEASSSNNLIDDETKTEAFRHIVAGACMSIGLKFAGTFNNDAYQTLLFWANYFTDLNDTKLATENCLCIIVLSLSIVMAGSGDLEVLRICRYLRSRVGPNYTHVTYGSQMAINMALSLLFMGGGRYTLKTDSLSVALMLCAFYPHFPVDSNDNRFHLQAFRHLYVLASEPRLLLSKDVDTGEFCYVPIEITLKSNEHHDVFKYRQMAPCILPELNKIQELKILGPRYYPIRFKQNLHFNDLKNILLSELLVKQKNGYFSYSDDPKDEKAFNIRNFLNKIIVPHKITPVLLEQITNEEHINQFAEILNKSDETEMNLKTNRLLKLIYESVVQETFDFVAVMLQLDKEANNEPSSQFIQEIKLVSKFYQVLNPTNSKNIITQEFLFSTINNLDSKLKMKIKNRHDLISCYLYNKYSEDLSSLLYYFVLNEITKQEIEYFSKCESFADLLVAKNSNISIEKLLRLYQLFKSN